MKALFLFLGLFAVARCVGGSALPFGLLLGRIDLAGFAPLITARYFSNRHN